MLLHINPTRQRGKCTGSLARASGWYMTFFAAGVITRPCAEVTRRTIAAGRAPWGAQTRTRDRTGKDMIWLVISRSRRPSLSMTSTSSGPRGWRLRSFSAGSDRVCAVKRCWVFSGCNSHPATGSLQPVAIGAAVEVTKPSEPSRQMCRFGDAASRQAVTQVIVEQASKRPMWTPTLHSDGEGRCRWGMNGETGGIGRPTSDQNPAGHRGNDDGMSVHGDPTQHGKPQAVRARDPQPDAREG